eukprot:CAMPEP_0117692082 /NCGR_PEP_ID=MMETSP0804-20121206/26113_1 /TAXON_ID=1074897 /ORGANISM="Tetraselmis astigmatica, Strain CCMP880" /LENGTH=1797 /DNA_ID=CAMNT_0005505457 /DNA_START=126 /DNA_END=5519 /DNA_ORIENTATION=+
MSGQGKSRLDKLLHLVEQGSSLATRQEAGRQIAEIAKASPAQLPTLQRKLCACLSSATWETRTTAAHTLGLMAEHLQQPSLDDIREAAGLPRGQAFQGQSGNPTEGEEAAARAAAAGFSFETFNMQQVLERGTPLLASGGQEYDAWREELAGATPEERLEKERKHLKKRLGLGQGMNSFMDTKDLVADEDLIASSTVSEADAAGAGKQQASQLVDEMAGGMSARERNRLKRKAKSFNRSDSGLGLPQQQSSKAPGDSDSTAGTAESLTIDEGQLVEEDIQEWRDVCSGRWMFQRIGDQMCEAALHPRWQVRHGAATALREILRSQAACAGITTSLPVDSATYMKPSDLHEGTQSPAKALEAEIANHAWLQDAVIRMLCILALDRFGDYVSDQVVAPVRETAAQVLGAAMKALPLASLKVVMKMLGQLRGREEWQVRHGCMLGWKYILASRKDLAGQLLPEALPLLIQGLQDRDDDVRAAAAEALVPVTDALLASSSDDVAAVRTVLWDILLDLQELSPSTSAVTHLLAQLYAPGTLSQGEAADDRSHLETLLPRLWPFLRHTLKSVRLGVLACAQGILEAEPQGGAVWLGPVLGQAAALLFQNMLLEEDEGVLEASGALWRQLLARSPPQSSLERAAAWAKLAATAPGASLPAALMLHYAAPPPGKPAGAAAATKEAPAAKRARLQAEAERATYGADRVVRAAAAWARRAAAGREGGGGDAHALAGLLAVSVEVLQRAQASCPVAGSEGPYSEVAPYYRQLASTFAASAPPSCDSLGLPAGWSPATAPPEQLQAAAAALLASSPSSAEALQAALAAVQRLEAVLHNMAQAALAAAVVAGGGLPPKLNTVVQPLMGVLRREPDPLLVAQAAQAVAALALMCTKRKPSPNAKMVGNLCAMACGDRSITPDTSAPEADPDKEEEAQEARGPKGEAAGHPPLLTADAVARLGAEAALRSLAAAFGAQLAAGLPRLWEFMAAPLVAFEQQQGEGGAVEVEPQSLVNAMQVLSTVGPAAAASSPAAWSHCLSLVPLVARCCSHSHTAVRSSAARAAAELANSITEEVMPLLLRLLVPMLSGSSDAGRRGAAEALSGVVTRLRARLAAHTVLLLVPLLGRMADPLPGVRRAATAAFAHLVELLPLAQGLPAPPGLDAAQAEAWAADGALLEQLLDNRKTADYRLPVALEGVALRRYQQEGINWLAFLRRFGLHGVLADDMGLGKTLQAIAIAAAASWESRQETGSELGIPSLIVCPPTLVGHWAAEICKFLGPQGVLRPLCYEGSSGGRLALQAEWDSGSYNVIIMSYETCRADISWLGPQRWLYAILDEGHIIKNAKTKVAQAVKNLIARHRLVLSGTPIQNDVLELWSIFDYLMPGFLGSERDFNSRFRRAVQVAKTSKRGSKQLEAGFLAAESLHRAVMPFVLRRTKEQVLSDLPPKIIQDVYCTMSPLQLALYDHFSKSSAAEEVRNGLSSSEPSSSSASAAVPHVFQSMQYLRKLCSHPAMAIDNSIPEHCSALETHAGVQGGSGWQEALRRDSLLHAPKLAALRDILCQCEIGKWDAASDGGMAGGNNNSSGHRVLVFAQLRSLLDLVERDLLQPAGVSFLRLDGNVAASKRFEVAQRFNADPTIEVLLLTTSVGGLGLNLTTADTVVFLEHDWNPQKDLQAMDRAHRLGQKRTVNVYRLLMRDTLEEKIMGMQRFKLDVANAVVNTDNVSLKNMDTAQLLDLFTPSKKAAGKAGAAASAAASAAAAAASEAGMNSAAAAGGGKGLKAMLAGLEELWDESQYAEEFSLEGFIGKLGRT